MDAGGDGAEVSLFSNTCLGQVPMGVERGKSMPTAACACSRTIRWGRLRRRIGSASREGPVESANAPHEEQP
jgi:hypothetical protein